MNAVNNAVDAQQEAAKKSMTASVFKPGRAEIAGNKALAKLYAVAEKLTRIFEGNEHSTINGELSSTENRVSFARQA